MAEETEAQEDLSVEDILSSIKDILMEDNAEQQKSVQDEEEKPESSEAEESKETEEFSTPEETADDVLTLSPSMIVEPSLSTTELRPEEKKEDNTETIDIDFEQELSDLQTDSVFDEIQDKEEPIVLSEASDTKGENLEQQTSFEELENIASSDIDAEPIFSNEDDVSQKENISDISLDNLVDEDTLNAILDNQPEEPLKPEDFVEPTDNVYENAVFEEKAGIEPKAMEAIPETVLPEEEEEISQQEISEEKEKDVKNTEEVEDTADISAGIISNFAKMFAEQQKQKQEPENKEEEEAKLKEQVLSQIELGDGSLSIEVLVRDVINGIVEKNLSKDYDFSAIAAAEIARQTKSWLNAHLPEIVEAEVKKEIERVMAKVSS